VDERLVDIEKQFKVFQEAMSASMTDKKTLEEAVDLAKTRGMAPSAGWVASYLEHKY